MTDADSTIVSVETTLGRLDQFGLDWVIVAQVDNG
ncbi:hypothetical protein ACVLV4_002189 [Rathayibacter agropyri]